MASGLTAERVRRDVEVVARAGLDIDTFFSEAVESLDRAVPHAAACLATVDPSTLLLTGARKYGDLLGRDEHDHEWGLLEYGEAEETAFTSMVRNRTVATGVHAATAGAVERSPRISRFMQPHFGYTDELRGLLRDGSDVWGGIALFRGPDDQPFGTEEIEFVGSLSAVFAAVVRAGLLARLAVAPPPSGSGPAVLIVGADNVIQQTSLGAEQRLADLLAGEASGAPDVVVTIEEARPPEIVPLVVAAFDLTQRERDVTQLVLQGVDTKEIAATMHISTYTVQDHLKSVFDKADVRSRRELIARIYFDQYVPRMGSELNPSGWFSAP